VSTEKKKKERNPKTCNQGQEFSFQGHEFGRGIYLDL